MQVLMLLECRDCGRKVIGVTTPGVEDHFFVRQAGRNEHGDVWVATEDEHWQRVVGPKGVMEQCPTCREKQP